MSAMRSACSGPRWKRASKGSSDSSSREARRRERGAAKSKAAIECDDFGTGSGFGDLGAQRHDIRGLHDVRIESGFDTLGDIGVRAIAGHRHQTDGAAALLAQRARDVIATHARKPDVDERDRDTGIAGDHRYTDAAV